VGNRAPVHTSWSTTTASCSYLVSNVKRTLGVHGNGAAVSLSVSPDLCFWVFYPQTYSCWQDMGYHSGSNLVVVAYYCFLWRNLIHFSLCLPQVWLTAVRPKLRWTSSRTCSWLRSSHCSQIRWVDRKNKPSPLLPPVGSEVTSLGWSA
jgi:hypothetical protein